MGRSATSRCRRQRNAHRTSARCSTCGSRVATYNRHAEKGEDPVFHKASDWIKPLTHPPYAAFDLTAPKTLYSTFTLGGLRARPTGEVLDPDGNPIPGLYAAGRNTSGMPAQGYNSGLSLADATFFGRHAGISAAAATVAGD